MNAMPSRPALSAAFRSLAAPAPLAALCSAFLLRVIFVALNFLSISGNMQYIIKGLIILAACSIDMRKYLVRK